MGNGPGRVVEVAVGDGPVDWASIGFTVDAEGWCRVGTVGIRLVGAGDERDRGIVGWTPEQAVQDGRRIATLRSGDEVPVPVAFMSAPPDTPGGSGDTPR